MGGEAGGLVTYHAARAAAVTLFIGETHAGIGLSCVSISGIQESRLERTDCDAVFDIAQAVGEEEGP